MFNDYYNICLLTRTLNVTPSFVIILSECVQPLDGLLENTLLSFPPEAPSMSQNVSIQLFTKCKKLQNSIKTNVL